MSTYQSCTDRLIPLQCNVNHPLLQSCFPLQMLPTNFGRTCQAARAFQAKCWAGAERSAGYMELWNLELWNYGITELWNYGIMKLWNYGLQHPPGKGCSTPLVEGAAPPSRGSSTPWQRVQHPLALILAPSEVLDFAKLLMYLSSQVLLWSSLLWMLEEY